MSAVANLVYVMIADLVSRPFYTSKLVSQPTPCEAIYVSRLPFLPYSVS